MGINMGMGGGLGGTLNQSQLGMMNNSPHGSMEMAFGTGGHGPGRGHAGSTGSGPTPPFFNPAHAPQHYIQQQQQQQHQHQHQQSPNNHVRFSSQPDVHWHPMAHSDSTSPFGNLEGLMASGATAVPGEAGIGNANMGSRGTGAGDGAQSGGTDDWTQRLGQQTTDTLRSRQHLEHDHERSTDPYQSIPPTRSGSLTPDDLLAPEDIINPLGAMSSMAGLVEAAVKASKSATLGKGEDDSAGGRSRGFDGSGGGDGGGGADGSGKGKGMKREAEAGAGMDEVKDTVSNAQEGEGSHASGARPSKRSRHSPILPSGPVIQELQHLPPQSSKERGKREKKKTHIHAYPDIVEEGLISEDEGRELMAM